MTHSRTFIRGALLCAVLAGCSGADSDAPPADTAGAAADSGAAAAPTPVAQPPVTQPADSAAAPATTGQPDAAQPSAAGQISPGATLDFRLMELPEAASVKASRGEIVITGTIGTPTTCQRLTGELARMGDTLRVDVRARAEGEGCGPQAGRFGYRAVVRGLSTGPHPLIVRHLPEPRSEAVEAHRSTVQVP